MSLRSKAEAGKAQLVKVAAVAIREVNILGREESGQVQVRAVVQDQEWEVIEAAKEGQ